MKNHKLSHVTLLLLSAMLLSAWTGETIALPFDEATDARYERLLAQKAGVQTGK